MKDSDRGRHYTGIPVKTGFSVKDKREVKLFDVKLPLNACVDLNSPTQWQASPFICEDKVYWSALRLFRDLTGRVNMRPESGKQADQVNTDPILNIWAQHDTPEDILVALLTEEFRYQTMHGAAVVTFRFVLDEPLTINGRVFWLVYNYATDRSLGATDYGDYSSHNFLKKELWDVWQNFPSNGKLSDVLFESTEKEFIVGVMP